MNSEAERACINVTPEARDCYERALEVIGPETTYLDFLVEVWGPDGIVRRHFPDIQRRVAFELSPVNRILLRKLAALSPKKNPYQRYGDELAINTIRYPWRWHEMLKDEAHEKRVSLNTLSAAKLAQPIHVDLVPGARLQIPLPFKG